MSFWGGFFRSDPTLEKRLRAGAMALFLPIVVLGCGAPAADPWQARCGAAFRQGTEALMLCLPEAPSPEDRCRIQLEIANLKRRQEGIPAYLAALTEVERSECGELASRAAMLGGEALLESGMVLEGLDLLRDVVLRHPNSYGAGEAVKRVSKARKEAAAKGVSTAKLFLGAYASTKGSRVAGHLLFFAAVDELAEREGAGFDGLAARVDALFMLMLLVDYHPESPLWDDGVWLAADLLSEGGNFADEVRLLEEALLPNRVRGMDSLLDGFAQKVRLRLARLYARQGRYDEALIQLDWVVNEHTQQGLKDDGLWLAGRVYRTKGDLEAERRTLEFLVGQCPWSRHSEKAATRLQEMK